MVALYLPRHCQILSFLQGALAFFENFFMTLQS